MLPVHGPSPDLISQQSLFYPCVFHAVWAMHNPPQYPPSTLLGAPVGLHLLTKLRIAMSLQSTAEGICNQDPQQERGSATAGGASRILWASLGNGPEQRCLQ